jgi:hypothetical protein
MSGPSRLGPVGSRRLDSAMIAFFFALANSADFPKIF